MNDPDTDRIIRFVVFCLEAYKHAEGIKGAEAVERFEHYGLTAYLRDGFDLLHTLGPDALMDDMRDYIRRRTEGAGGIA